MGGQVQNADSQVLSRPFGRTSPSIKYAQAQQPLAVRIGEESLHTLDHVPEQQVTDLALMLACAIPLNVLQFFVLQGIDKDLSYTRSSSLPALTDGVTVQSSRRRTYGDDSIPLLAQAPLPLSELPLLSVALIATVVATLTL